MKAVLRNILAVMAVCVTAVAGTQALAQEPQKPTVAIRLPTVGEKVSSGVQRYLDLPELLTEIEASIQATRKFDVLSRDKSKMSAIAEEQAFASSQASAGNAAASGQMQAANYLVIPTVRDFVFYRSTKAVPNLANKWTRQDSGRLNVDAQVVDTETGQIKFTFSTKATFGTAKEVVNSSGGAPSKSWFTRMAKEVGGDMADQLVDGVFPMMVLKADGTQVWLNRGSDGGIKEGTVLAVFRPGESLIDPYTGENLGSAEREVGSIKITRVNPKFSIATVVKQTEPVAAQDILRKP